MPDADGDPFAVGGLAADEIVINPQAADELDAGVGDTIVLRVRGEPHSFRIVEIGESGFLTGEVQEDSSGGVLSAARARELVGQADDDWALVVVSGAGGIKGALDNSAALDEDLGAWLKEQARGQSAGLREQRRAHPTVALSVGADQGGTRSRRRS